MLVCFLFILLLFYAERHDEQIAWHRHFNHTV